jgi:SAM-dependent methyltransferase
MESGAVIDQGKNALINEALTESRRRQRDHHVRMSAQQGVGPDHAADKVSYTDLVALIPSGGLLLDVGACAGGAYPYLRERWAYHACDLLPEVVTALTAAGIPNVKLSPVEQLDYPDASFDVVFARHVLEHACDLPLALAEVRRVLRPSGTLAFAVPSCPHVELAHYQILDVTQWERAFYAAGFSLLHTDVHPHHLQEFYGIAQPVRGGEVNG